MKSKSARICGMGAGLRAHVFLLMIFLLVGCTSPAALHITSDATPATLPPGKIGVHLLLDDGRGRWPVDVWPEHMQAAREAVGEWGYVVQLVRSDDLDPSRWQMFMDLCADLQLTPILRLATTFDREANLWVAPPQDNNGSYRAIAGQYAAFVFTLRWPTAEHYVIVGNEPNHGNEWGGVPDPAAYARFLIDVADALHAADPAVRVLNGALDPYAPHTGGVSFVDGMVYVDAEAFMDEMVAAYPDVFSRVDVWASHAYPIGFAAAPWEQTYQVDLLNGAENPYHIEPPPGVANRGVNGYEWELFKLSTYGIGGLPVMITETGWRHSETTDPASLDGGEGLPNAETAALYLDLALRGNDDHYSDLPGEGWTPWLEDDDVMAVIIFALNGNPAEWGHTNLLALDDDGAVLETYAPLDLLSAIASEE